MLHHLFAQSAAESPYANVAYLLIGFLLVGAIVVGIVAVVLWKTRIKKD
jgi:hypothetical protein